MHTTHQLARAIQSRYKKTSAYGLAKLMSVSNQTACAWVNKETRFSTESAIKCAELLSLQPAYVVACAMFEKESSEEAKAFWKHLADNLPADFEDEKAA